MTKTLYIAVDNESGELVRGARGHVGFCSKEELNRSVAQAYRYGGYAEKARKLGVKASTFYTVKRIDVGTETFMEVLK